MLPARSTKSVAILKTNKSSKIRLTYSTETDDDGTSKTAIEKTHWSNTILRDSRGGALDFFSRLTNQKKYDLKSASVPLDTDVKRLSNVCK